MRILAVGDLVGQAGLKKFEQEYQKIKENENIDFCVVNAENVADGMGITEKAYRSLTNQKIDCITMGNHTWAKKDVFGFIDNSNIVRPANYSKNNPGKGYRVFECKGKKIAVINLIGRVTMAVLSENPFIVADEIVEKIKDTVDIIIIDFHAEATAEKIALAYHLDGKITALYGTHTHVQTADETILENGTAYITDIGMTGPKKSVIGMSTEASIKRFLTSLPERYKIAEGEAKLNACIFEINEEDCRVKAIKRICVE